MAGFKITMVIVMVTCLVAGFNLTLIGSKDTGLSLSALAIPPASSGTSSTTTKQTPTPSSTTKQTPTPSSTTKQPLIPSSSTKQALTPRSTTPRSSISTGSTGATHVQTKTTLPVTTQPNMSSVNQTESNVTDPADHKSTDNTVQITTTDPGNFASPIFASSSVLLTLFSMGVFILLSSNHLELLN